MVVSATMSNPLSRADRSTPIKALFSALNVAAERGIRRRLYIHRSRRRLYIRQCAHDQRRKLGLRPHAIGPFPVGGGSPPDAVFTVRQVWDSITLAQLCAFGNVIASIVYILHSMHTAQYRYTIAIQAEGKGRGQLQRVSMIQVTMKKVSGKTI